MKKTIEINADLYEKLRKESKFFLKLNIQYYYDKYGSMHDSSQWQSINEDLGISFPAHKFGSRNLGYCLCIIDKAEPVFNDEGNPISGRVNMFFHEASATDSSDCMFLIKNCIERSKDKEDKYAFVELLWFLNQKGVDLNSLKTAIGHYDNYTKSSALEILRRICRCLSLNKQKIIKSIFDIFGSKYDIYMPTLVIEAVKCCKLSCDTSNLNLFQLVDNIINVEREHLLKEADANDNNLLLQMLTWLYTEKSLEDYNKLKSLFSIVAEPIRLDIVKRYFHDIRLGHTILDLNLLAQFKDNQFDEFIRYRYAIETPLERIVLTVPLLCDNILTLYNTKGKAFQSFDGVLDFAMTHCDKVHPMVDLKLERIIPVCKNGAVYNSGSFKGFIDYQVIRKIDHTKLTDSSLLCCIRGILDKHGRRRHYPVCKLADNTRIDDAQFEKCSQKFKSDKKKLNLECYTYKYYDDKWIVNSDPTNIAILNSFLSNSIEVSKTVGDISVDVNMISLDVFRNFILSLPSLFEDLGNDEFLVNSYKSKDRTYQLSIIEQYSDILRMRIFPQKGALVGRKFDVFGFWKEIKHKFTPEQLKDEQSPQYLAAYETYEIRETEEVNKRTIESLKKDFNITEYNGYVELPYERDTLVKVLSKYYFKESFKNDDDISEHEFLTAIYIKGNFRPYCAPKLSEVNNPAINLPYFWCRGKECFHNNLENQTLKETDDWHGYSLYHLIEIVGYPKLHETIAGNEPDPIVRNFIAVTNKAMQKFRRLKCRTCGHLMFTDKGSGFNRYNYYSCINPTCAEAWKPVYLSYCYSCKKGLIDSRDTKQCPNGWYICPTCLSCCDDAQYERQAQRYILSNRPIPERIKQMLGRDHNDKDEYFCPSCGANIEIKEDEHGLCYKSCSSCNKKIDNTLEEDFGNYYSQL